MFSFVSNEEYRRLVTVGSVSRELYSLLRRSLVDVQLHHCWCPHLGGLWLSFASFPRPIVTSVRILDCEYLLVCSFLPFLASAILSCGVCGLYYPLSVQGLEIGNCLLLPQMYWQ